MTKEKAVEITNLLVELQHTEYFKDDTVIITKYESDSIDENR
jgi:hypothetical protein